MIKKTFIYLLFILNLSFILWLWWYPAGVYFAGGSSEVMISFGRLAGLLAAFFALMQFMLIGRAIWLEKTFGLDKLSRVHRLNGHLAIIFILLHPVLITFGYAQASQKAILTQFTNFLTGFDDIIWAFIAVILFILIVGFSITIVRKHLKYELWHSIHFLTYAAITLAFLHQIPNGSDFYESKYFIYYWYGLYIFVLGQFILFRYIRPAYLYFRHKFYIEKIVEETKDTASIYITGKNIQKFKIQPGQFMILWFLSKKFILDVHPFSFSQVPNGKNLRVTVKNVGDFTSQVSSLVPGTKVVIDGPYGVFTEKESRKDKILLIAGGIGITPIRSIAEQMAHDGKDIILLYANKTVEDIVFKNELDQLSKQFNFPIHYFLSDDSKDDYINGRITIEKINELVDDVKDREVYMCGPKPMTAQLDTDLRELGVSRSYIHYERFAL